MLYADYQFYIEKYNGSLGEEQFDKFVISASAHVRRVTFGRANADMEEVKLATCAVCDVLAEGLECKGRFGISSENTDGYSVSYASEKEHDDTMMRKIYSAAELYLDGTGILDWGIDNDDEF